MIIHKNSIIYFYDKYFLIRVNNSNERFRYDYDCNLIDKVETLEDKWCKTPPSKVKMVDEEVYDDVDLSETMYLVNNLHTVIVKSGVICSVKILKSNVWNKDKELKILRDAIFNYRFAGFDEILYGLILSPKQIFDLVLKDDVKWILEILEDECSENAFGFFVKDIPKNRKELVEVVADLCVHEEIPMNTLNKITNDYFNSSSFMLWESSYKDNDFNKVCCGDEYVLELYFNGDICKHYDELCEIKDQVGGRIDALQRKCGCT